MKKSLIFVGVLSIGYATAQTTDYEGRVGINTEEPKATLDVKSTSADKAKGILTPQVSGDDLKTMTGNLTSAQHGLISFATSGITTADDATANVQFPGYHRFNVSGAEKSWVRLEPSGLEKIKGTGTNVGWRLIGSSLTSTIGNNAVDISHYIARANKNPAYIEGATGNYSFASGLNTSAMGNASVAMGEGTVATGFSTTALGWGSKSIGNRSFAVGNLSRAEAFASMAIGYNIVSSVESEFAIGAYNKIHSTGISRDNWRIFVVGNGEGSPNGDNDTAWESQVPGRKIYRSDAFTILRNGKVGIDIDNFETTTSDAKLQVNGKILANSLAGTGNRPVYADENGVLVIGTGTSAPTPTGATTLTGEENLECNATNRGKMNFVKNDAGFDVFGICMKGTNGYSWRYIYGNGGVSNGSGNFGSGLQ